MDDPRGAYSYRWRVGEQGSDAVASTGGTAGGAGVRRWVGLGVLASALSMIVLDGTIVGVALPTLITELQLDFSEAQWVNGIYSVVFAALLLTAGRLGDRLGRRRAMFFGIALFLAGSLLAALSSSGDSLIIARLVQGIGGAFILPTTLSTVNATFRGRDRAVAFGVWGAVISGVAALGPLLGGWLTESFGWQWIFLVNLPFGIAIAVVAIFTVDETRAHVTSPGLDIDGLLLSAIGFGALVFGLIEGGSLGWWAPEQPFVLFGWTWPADWPVSPVPVALAIGVVSLVLFVLWERHRARNGRSAILDVRLFSVPTFTWGNLVALCVAVGEFGILFVLPLFIVNALGLSTLAAGFVLAAMGLGAFVSGAAARHLSERLGAPNVVLLGLTIEFVGAVLAALMLGPDMSGWWLAAVLALYGLGLGLASAQLTGTVLADIPPEQSGQGSATQSTVRQVGSALGTAIIGAVLAAGLAQALPAQLDGQSGLSAEAEQQVITSTEQSAGANIPPLRAEGTDGQLGEAGPPVADALSAGMADASRWALFAASGFLLAGGVFALRLRAKATSARGPVAAASGE
ncbi:DHA2 family efflux MFS transporter permease subunit [Agromyces lapidis]|uniref:DHA2 family efflux MFS transporter permease subunit n=2 Tax=Agromyces lapidis TaxID=279574 RepID=A0ABV5ST94_9MICO|nr:DHA2 family efflux MFS transporter permease subunit [Agromyces lapidis]